MKVPPGRYTVKFRLRFPDVENGLSELMEWRGDLETAAVTIEVKAAKTAVEADGYKRVTVLGKGPNGAWRAKGFRGATEVLLTVDDTGRVSMD